VRKKEKLEIIYSAALKVFAEYGFKKATVEDIASELGVTKGNLYLYAKDKKDLYQKSVEYALLRWQVLVRDAIARESDVRKQFMVMGEKALEYLSMDNDLRRVLVRDPDIFPLFPSNDPYARINRNSVVMIRSILKRGMDEGVFRSVNLDALPEALFSIYKMLVIRAYIVQEGAPMRKLFDELLGAITLGIYRHPAARGGVRKLRKKDQSK
jgi:AcrR family transcriptional regulator